MSRDCQTVSILLLFRHTLKMCLSWPGQCSRFSHLLRAGRSRNLIPMQKRFSAPVKSGLQAHPAYSTMYTGHRVSSKAVKRPGRVVDHPPPSRAEVKEWVELYLYSPSGPSWPVLGQRLSLPTSILIRPTAILPEYYIKWGISTTPPARYIHAAFDGKRSHSVRGTGGKIVQRHIPAGPVKHTNTIIRHTQIVSSKLTL
jgi:hypothetical protein